jgi:hypothetical protein
MKQFLSALTCLALSSATVANANDQDRNLGKVKEFFIKGCLAQFGEHPFDVNELETFNYKILAPTINVLNGNSVLLDDAQTEEPQLIIVAGAVNVMGNATYKFLNSNGWYCLTSNVSVFGSTTIDLNIDSHLTQFNIAVGSELKINKVDASGQPIPEPTPAN